MSIFPTPPQLRAAPAAAVVVPTAAAAARAATGLLLLVTALLSGCGQTGPLYLPEDEGATVITRPAGGTAAPAPAPTTPQSPATPVPDAGQRATAPAQAAPERSAPASAPPAGTMGTGPGTTAVPPANTWPRRTPDGSVR